MTKSREYYVSEPIGSATAVVIWLHGLGADGNDFAGIVDQLGLPATHSIRFYFPSAPYRNITINQGMRMRAWYDIYDLNRLSKEDEAGIIDSQQELEEMIAQQLDLGIASERIILAGFSQGGAMALYTGLRYAKKLGGIISLSSYFVMANSFNPLNFPANHNVPIFMAHGIFDPVVQYNLGQQAHELLEGSNYNVEWFSYPMAHTVCMEEITAIGEFIKRCLGYA